MAEFDQPDETAGDSALSEEPTEEEVVEALVSLFTIFITIDRRMKREEKLKKLKESDPSYIKDPIPDWLDY